MSMTAALEVPVRDTATITVATGRPPETVQGNTYAYEAWQVWDMLSRRRQAKPHADEFTPRTHDGREGHVWDQSMAEAVRLKHGPSIALHARKCVTDFLQDTGNAVNVGGRAVAARWWFPTAWNDVSPAKATTPRTAPTTRLSVAPAPGDVKCRFCQTKLRAAPKTAEHEREKHPAQYAAAAEYLCPILIGADQCGSPHMDKKSFGRHLSVDHHISSATDRERIYVTGQQAAARARQDTAADHEPPRTLDEAAPVVNAGQELPAAIKTPRPLPRVPVPPFQPPTPAPVPVPGPVPPSAAPAAPVQRTAPAQGTDPVRALAALDELRSFLVELGPGYTNLQAELAAERDRANAERDRANAAEARVGKYEDRLAGLLDLVTSG